MDIKKSLLIFFSLWCQFINLVSVGFAATGTPFLILGSGAKPASLGNAYVGLATDINSLYWNPAGLGFITNKQVTGTYIHWFEDVRGMYLGGVYPLKAGGSVGASITYLTIGGLTRYEAGLDKGSIRFYNLAATVSYGREYKKNIHIGATGKIIQETIDRTTGSGFAVDIAGLYKIPEKKVILGVGIYNLGTGITFLEATERLPMTIRVGGAYLYSDELTFAVAADRITTFNFHLGAEYLYKKQFAFRVGYTKNNITFGLGLKRKEFTVDYAYVPVVADFAATHRITLTYLFPVPAIQPASTVTKPEPALQTVTEPSKQEPLCAICRKPLTFIKQYDRYYCYPCKQYAPEEVKPVPVTLPIAPTDARPPEVILTIPQNIFSPSGSFNIKATDDTAISSWKIEITNMRGKTVKIIEGKNTPPTTVSWDGKDDHYNEVVPPGKYNVVFTAIDTAGNKKSTPAQEIQVIIP